MAHEGHFRKVNRILTSIGCNTPQWSETDSRECFRSFEGANKMEIDARKTVKEIAVGMPSSVKVFEELGIDYCCGGEKRLDEVCQAAGLDVEVVTRALEAAGNTAQPKGTTVDWSEQPLALLMNHIVEKHHAFCRQEVARLEPLLEKVVQAHSAVHPELRRIQALFSGLSKELLMHLTKE